MAFIRDLVENCEGIECEHAGLSKYVKNQDHERLRINDVPKDDMNRMVITEKSLEITETYW